MNSKNTIELKIEDIVYRGTGLARLDGMIYFVEDVLPGEIVRAQIIKRKKNLVETKLVEILKKSPMRVESACKYTKQCEGCCYQHMEYDTEIKFKHNQLINLLERIGGCSGIPGREPVRSPFASGYRNKISLHTGNYNGRKSLGYYMKDNRSVLDIRECPLAIDQLNSLLAELRNNLSLSFGRKLTLRYTENDGALYWSNRSAPAKKNLIEKTPLGNITVPVKSFFQVNPHAAEALFLRLSEILQRIRPEAVIDIYCGTGVFAFAAAKTGIEKVLGIDTDKLAIKSAIKNSRRMNYTSVIFRHGYAGSLLEDALKEFKTDNTLIILDPPRAGLEKRVVDILCEKKPRDIVYVSCAADTMARDVKILTENGYSLAETGLIDMFPRTAYFESVTHLSCKR